MPTSSHARGEALTGLAMSIDGADPFGPVELVRGERMADFRLLRPSFPLRYRATLAAYRRLQKALPGYLVAY
jgi:hypothetical protein